MTYFEAVNEFAKQNLKEGDLIDIEYNNREIDLSKGESTEFILKCNEVSAMPRTEYIESENKEEDDREIQIPDGIITILNAPLPPYPTYTGPQTPWVREDRNREKEEYNLYKDSIINWAFTIYVSEIKSITKLNESNLVFSGFIKED